MMRWKIRRWTMDDLKVVCGLSSVCGLTKVALVVLSALLIAVTPVLAQDEPTSNKLPAPNRKQIARNERQDGTLVPAQPEDPEADEPGIVLRAFATPLEESPEPFYRLSLRAMWHRAERICQTSLFQNQRLYETGQPMLIDQDGIYYRRDLYSQTKGVILESFFDGKLDVGLYERRYSQTATYVTGKPLYDYGAYRQGESYIFSGGRQIFVGVRLDVGKLLKKR